MQSVKKTLTWRVKAAQEVKAAQGCTSPKRLRLPDRIDAAMDAVHSMPAKSGGNQTGASPESVHIDFWVLRGGVVLEKSVLERDEDPGMRMRVLVCLLSFTL